MFLRNTDSLTDRGYAMKTAPAGLKEVATKVNRVIDEVGNVIIGKRHTITLLTTAVLCNGHVLIEDVPGVGKTMLAKSLARALGCSFKRIQFTPDLLPADITGTSMYNQRDSEFEFRPGPVFAQFVLADEINRATPKTQSSLLECMGEQQITIDGVTRPMPVPFFVIATENNIEYRGTYPLPEAQLDRFLMKLEIGYPDPKEESRILDSQAAAHPVTRVQTVLSAEEVVSLQAIAKDVHLDQSLRDYIVEIVSATRRHPMVALGSSPRGSLSLSHASRAYAAIAGRDYVVPDDIKALAVPVLAHRLMMKPEARIRFITAADAIQQIASSIAVPS